MIQAYLYTLIIILQFPKHAFDYLFTFACGNVSDGGDYDINESLYAGLLRDGNVITEERVEANEIDASSLAQLSTHRRGHLLTLTALQWCRNKVHTLW